MAKKNAYIAQLEERKNKKKTVSAPLASNTKSNQAAKIRAQVNKLNTVQGRANTVKTAKISNNAAKAAKKSTNAKNAQRRIKNRTGGSTSISNRTSRNNTSTSAQRTKINQHNKIRQRLLQNTDKLNKQIDTAKNPLVRDSVRQKYLKDGVSQLQKPTTLIKNTVSPQQVGKRDQTKKAANTNLMSGKQKQSSNAGLQATTPEGIKAQMKTKVGRESVLKQAKGLNERIQSADNPRAEAYEIDKNPVLREIRAQAGILEKKEKEKKAAEERGHATAQKSYDKGSRLQQDISAATTETQRKERESLEEADRRAEDRVSMAQTKKLVPNNMKAEVDKMAKVQAQKTGVGKTAQDWYDWEEKYPNWRQVKSVKGKAPEGTKAGDVVVTSSGSWAVKDKNAQTSPLVDRYVTVEGDKTKWNEKEGTTTKGDLPAERTATQKRYDKVREKEELETMTAHDTTSKTQRMFDEADLKYGYSVKKEWMKEIEDAGDVGVLSKSWQSQSGWLGKNDLYSGYMTDEEKETYRFLWYDEGSGKANQYANKLKPELEERQEAATAKKINEHFDKHFKNVDVMTLAPVLEETVDENGNRKLVDTGRKKFVKSGESKEVYTGSPVVSALETVIGNTVTAIPGIIGNTKAAITGDEVGNEWYNVLTKNYTREYEGTIEGIDSSFGKKVYTLGTALVDVGVQVGTTLAVTAAVGAATGGAGAAPAAVAGGSRVASSLGKVAKGWRTATKINKSVGVASSVLWGTKSAQQTFVSSFDKTGDVGLSLANGYAAGAMEVAGERIFNPIEKLMNPTAPLTKATLAKNIGRSFLGEGLEEGVTQVGQVYSDYVILGDKSDYSEAVTAYKESGLSDKEARRKASIELYGKGSLEAMVYGAIAGGVAGGVMNVRSYRNTAKVLKNSAKSDRNQYYLAGLASNNLSDSELYEIIEPEIKHKYSEAADVAELTNNYIEKLRAGKIPIDTNNTVAKDIARTVVNSEMTDSAAIETANKVLNHEVTSTDELMKMKKSLTEYSAEKVNGMKAELAEYVDYRTEAPETIRYDSDGFSNAWLNKSAEILNYIEGADVLDTDVLFEYNKYSDALLGGDVLSEYGRSSVAVRRSVNNVLYQYDGSAVGRTVDVDDYEYRDIGTLTKLKDAVDGRGDGDNVPIAKINAVPDYMVSNRKSYGNQTQNAAFSVAEDGTLFVEYTTTDVLTGEITTNRYAVVGNEDVEYTTADVTDRLMNLFDDDTFIGQAFQMYMNDRATADNIDVVTEGNVIAGISTEASEGNFATGVRYKTELTDGTKITVDVTNDSRMIHSRIRTEGEDWLYCDLWNVSDKVSAPEIKAAITEQIGFDVPPLYMAVNNYLFKGATSGGIFEIEYKANPKRALESTEFAEEYGEMVEYTDLPNMFREVLKKEDNKRIGRRQPKQIYTYADATVKVYELNERTAIKFKTAADEKYKTIVIDSELAPVTAENGKTTTRYPVGVIMSWVEEYSGDHIVPYLVGEYMREGMGDTYDIETENRLNTERVHEQNQIGRESEKIDERRLKSENPFDGGIYLDEDAKRMFSSRQKLKPILESKPRANQNVLLSVPMGDGTTLIVPGVFRKNEFIAFKNGEESENMGDPATWQGITNDVVWGYQTAQYEKVLNEDPTELDVPNVSEQPTSSQQETNERAEVQARERTDAEYEQDIESSYGVNVNQLIDDVSTPAMAEQYMLELLDADVPIEEAVKRVWQNGYDYYVSEQPTWFTRFHEGTETPDNNRMIYSYKDDTTKWFVHDGQIWTYSDGEVQSEPIEYLEDGQWRYTDESNSDVFWRDLALKMRDRGDTGSLQYLRTKNVRDDLFDTKQKRGRYNSERRNNNSTVETSDDRTIAMSNEREFPRTISRTVEERNVKRKLKNIRDVTNFCEEKFGVKVKKNPEAMRHREPTVLGFHYSPYNFIWASVNNAYGTFLHEFGHAVDNLGSILEENTSEVEHFAQNLSNYTEYLSKCGYNPSKYTSELLADYMSVYMCNPDAAWQIGKSNEVDGHENFYNVFEGFFSKKDLDNLHTLQYNVHETLNNASEVEKTKGHMTTYADEKKRNQSKGWQAVIKAKDEFRRAIVKRNAPAEKLERQISRARGQEIDYNDKLSAAIELSGQASSISESLIKKGGVFLRPRGATLGYVADTDMKTLDDILDKFDKAVSKTSDSKLKSRLMNTWYDDLGAYMLAYHAIDRERIGQTTISDELAGKGSDAHIAHYEKVISDLLAQYGTSIETARQEIMTWYDEIVKAYTLGVTDQHGGFMLTDSMYRKWKTQYPNYVPMNRVHDGKTKKLFEANSKTGSERDIYHPIESMMLNVNRFVENYTQKAVAKSFLKFAKSKDSDVNYFMNQYVEVETAKETVALDDKGLRIKEAVKRYAEGLDSDVDKLSDGDLQRLYVQAILEGEMNVGAGDTLLIERTSKSNEGRYVVYDDGGTKYTFTFTDKTFEKMMLNLDHHQRTALGRLAGKLTRAFSAVTTSLNPMFALNNAIRDFQHGIINTESRYKWDVFNLTYIPEYTKTLLQIFLNEIGLKPDARLDAMQAINGHASRLYTQRDYISKSKYRKQGLKNVPVVDVSKAFVHLMENMNGIIENTPRYLAYNRAYDKAIKHGKTDAEANVVAAQAARESTVNFSNRGTATDVLSAVVPFIGASIAGIEQFKSLIFNKDTWTTHEGLSKIARALATQSVVALLYAFSHKDDDEYKSFSTYYKLNYWLFKLPNGTWLKLPKDREYSALFADLPMMLVDVMTNPYVTSEEGMSEWFNYMLSMLRPSTDLTLLTAVSDVRNGKTWYDGDILSYEDETLFDGGVDYYDQITDESTSAIADWLAKKMQMLPDGVLEWMGVGATPKGQHYLIDQLTGGVGDILLPLTTKTEGLEGTLASILNKYTADPSTSNEYVADAWDEYATMKAEFEIDGEKDWWEGSEQEKWYKTITTLMQSTSSTTKNPQFYTIGDYSKMIKQALKDTDMSYEERAEFIKDCRDHIAQMAERVMLDYNKGELKDADYYCEVRVPEGIKESGFKSGSEYERVYRDLIHGKGYETESKFAIVASNLTDEQKDFLSEHAGIGTYTEYVEEIQEAIDSGLTVDTFADVRAQVKEKCNGNTSSVAKWAATYEITKGMGLSDKQISYFTDSIGTSDYTNVITAAFENGYTADDVISIVSQVKEEGLRKSADKQTRAAQIAEKMGKDGTIAAAFYSTVPKRTDANESSGGGDFVSPLADGTYYVSSLYGARNVSIGSHNHGGVDLAAPSGTRISSATTGTVIKSGYSGGYGNAVYVQMADGRTVIYGHMKQASALQVGDTVQQGDTIGYVGTTGTSSGNHLHLEIRDANGNSINPNNYYEYSKGGKTFTSKGTGGSVDTSDVSDITQYLKLWADASKVATGEAKKQKNVKSKISSTYKGDENKALRKKLYKWAEANYEK